MTSKRKKIEYSQNQQTAQFKLQLESTSCLHIPEFSGSHFQKIRFFENLALIPNLFQIVHNYGYSYRKIKSL